MTLAGARCRHKRNRGGPHRAGGREGKGSLGREGGGVRFLQHLPGGKGLLYVQLKRARRSTSLSSLSLRRAARNRHEKHRSERVLPAVPAASTNQAADAMRAHAHVLRIKGEAGPQFARAQAGRRPWQTNQLRKGRGIFGGKSFILMLTFHFLSFLFSPCLWRILRSMGVQIWFFQLRAVAAPHLLPPGKYNFKTYLKVKGTVKKCRLGPKRPNYSQLCSRLICTQTLHACWSWQVQTLFLRTTGQVVLSSEQRAQLFSALSYRVCTIWLTQMLKRWFQREKRSSAEFNPGWTSQLLDLMSWESHNPKLAVSAFRNSVKWLGWGLGRNRLGQDKLNWELRLWEEGKNWSTVTDPDGIATELISKKILKSLNIFYWKGGAEEFEQWGLPLKKTSE